MSRSEPKEPVGEPNPVCAQARQKSTVGCEVDGPVVMHNPKVTFKLPVLDAQLFEFIATVHAGHRWKARGYCSNPTSARPSQG